MADIISFDDKQHISKQHKAAIERKQKVVAARMVLHCMHCPSKCEKCGSQIQLPAERQKRMLTIPYRFCENCSKEYKDYIERLKGGGDPDCYWQNDKWIDVWQRWIAYRGSIDSYLKSKEFQQLLLELKQNEPDQ